MDHQTAIDVSQEEFVRIRDAIQALVARADMEYEGIPEEVKKLHLSKLLFELSSDVCHQRFEGDDRDQNAEGVFRFVLFIAERYCGVSGLTKPLYSPE